MGIPRIDDDAADGIPRIDDDADGILRIDDDAADGIPRIDDDAADGIPRIDDDADGILRIDEDAVDKPRIVGSYIETLTDAEKRRQRSRPELIKLSLSKIQSSLLLYFNYH